MSLNSGQKKNPSIETTKPKIQQEKGEFLFSLVENTFLFSLSRTEQHRGKRAVFDSWEILNCNPSSPGLFLNASPKKNQKNHTTA